MPFLWRILGQLPNLTTLERLPQTPGVEQGPRSGGRRDHYHCVVAQEKPGAPKPDGPFRRLERAIRLYRIFPSWLVTGVLRRPVEVGDTYGICFHCLPGIDWFFGGRVTTVLNGPEGGVWRGGFHFATVQGHPELGEETFRVEKDMANGVVRVGLTSWSRPAMWLSRLAAPLARLLQVFACHSALDQLQRVALGRGGHPRPGCD
jgi:hypothetical protein